MFSSGIYEGWFLGSMLTRIFPLGSKNWFYIFLSSIFVLRYVIAMHGLSVVEALFSESENAEYFKEDLSCYLSEHIWKCVFYAYKAVSRALDHHANLAVGPISGRNRGI